MLVVHKESQAIEIAKMTPGTVFYNDSGSLCMVTDGESDGEWIDVVYLDTGLTGLELAEEVRIPLKITMVEVDNK